MNLVYIATRIAGKPMLTMREIAAYVASSPSVDSDTPTFDIKVGDRVKVKNYPGIWEVTKFPVELKNSKELYAKIAPVDPLLDKVQGIVLVHKDDSTVNYRPWLQKKGFAPYRTDGLSGNINAFTAENDGPNGYVWNRPTSVTLDRIVKI